MDIEFIGTDLLKQHGVTDKELFTPEEFDVLKPQYEALLVEENL